jgi:glycosyltransferase involved in cell wall biosynthesis
VIDRVEFYRQDVRILREIGFHVTVVTRLRDLVSADIYFVWWWTWALFPLLLAKLLKKPVVITGVFDAWIFESRPILHRKMLVSSLRYADVNVFVSEMEHQEIPRSFAVNNPKYVPIGVDTDLYLPGAMPRRRGQLLTIAGMAGDNAVRKGVPEAIEVCALLRNRGHDVTLTIAGEKGSGYRALADLAESLGISDHVLFPGLIGVEEKVKSLQECFCYLQPSKFEGFGLAMLEAMSCGAPVVVRPAGAIPEVVGKAGMLVAQDGAAAVADAVERLILDEALAAELGAAARERAIGRFSIHRRLAELTSIFETVR